MTLAGDPSRPFEDLRLVAGGDQAGGDAGLPAGVRTLLAERVASAAALNGRHVLRDVLQRLGFELK
jgi:hypothetical protein